MSVSRAGQRAKARPEERDSGVWMSPGKPRPSRRRVPSVGWRPVPTAGPFSPPPSSARLCFCPGPRTHRPAFLPSLARWLVGPRPTHCEHCCRSAVLRVGDTQQCLGTLWLSQLQRCCWHLLGRARRCRPSLQCPDTPTTAQPPEATARAPSRPCACE